MRSLWRNLRQPPRHLCRDSASVPQKVLKYSTTSINELIICLYFLNWTVLKIIWIVWYPPSIIRWASSLITTSDHPAMDKQHPQSVHGSDNQRKYGAFQNEIYRGQLTRVTLHTWIVLTTYPRWNVLPQTSRCNHWPQPPGRTSKIHIGFDGIQLCRRRSGWKSDDGC